MKLSQLTTLQLSDVLLRLTPPLCRILQDENTLAALDAVSFSGLDTRPPLLRLTLMWEKLSPIVLQHHAEDALQALSVLTGKSTQELQEQPGLTTLSDLISIWDEQLTSFFSCAGSAEQERS